MEERAGSGLAVRRVISCLERQIVLPPQTKEPAILETRGIAIVVYRTREYATSVRLDAFVDIDIDGPLWRMSI